jgi:hypothetical protein
MTMPIRGAVKIGGSMTIELHCRRCGAEFVPAAEAIRAGAEVYRHCPGCQPPADAPERACEGCGRPLRGKRTICLTCLGVTP